MEHIGFYYFIHKEFKVFFLIIRSIENEIKLDLLILTSSILYIYI